MQTDGAGKHHLIAFASRILSTAEKNYSVAHLEILAIVRALKHIRDITMGYKITVYTDHHRNIQRQESVGQTSSMVSYYTGL